MIDEVRAIVQLMAKRKSGLLMSEAENHQLDEWLSRSAAHAKAWDDFDNDEVLMQEVKTYNELSELYKERGEIFAEKRARMPMHTLYIRYAAIAAAVLGIFFTLVYINRDKPAPKNEVAVVAPAYDILPGSAKAILQMADGKRYELNASGRENLGSEAGQAIKTNNGQLLYESIDGDNNPATVSSNNIVTTPRGGGYQIRLSDGTLVLLNAASTISFPSTFHSKARIIELSGEAFLTVSKVTDASGKPVPFIVKTSFGDVEVLGTKFNVNTYGDKFRMKTTLLEGRVGLKVPNKEQVILAPGQRATIEQANESVVVKNLPDPAAEVAWCNNQFYFKDESFEGVMKQLSRWYNVEVQYVGKVPEFTGGGFIQRDIKLDELLKQLSFTLHDKVGFEIRGHTLVVSQK